MSTKNPVRFVYMQDGWIAFGCCDSREIIEKIKPELKTTPYIVIDDRDLYRFDPDFLSAVELTEAGALELSLDKAKIVHKRRLREQRAPLLEALDVAYMRALERQDEYEVSLIAEKKQALRDLPDAVDAATSLIEIRAIALPGS